MLPQQRGAGGREWADLAAAREGLHRKQHRSKKREEGIERVPVDDSGGEGERGTQGKDWPNTMTRPKSAKERQRGGREIQGIKVPRLGRGRMGGGSKKKEGRPVPA